MRAVGLMAHGGPEVLELVDLSEVKALAGQIRIRNYAAAVNPTDVVARNGTLAKIQKKTRRLAYREWMPRALSTRWVRA